MRTFARGEFAREVDVDDGAGCVDDETAGCDGGVAGYDVEAAGGVEAVCVVALRAVDDEADDETVCAGRAVGAGSGLSE